MGFLSWCACVGRFGSASNGRRVEVQALCPLYSGQRFREFWGPWLMLPSLIVCTSAGVLTIGICLRVPDLSGANKEDQSVPGDLGTNVPSRCGSSSHSSACMLSPCDGIDQCTGTWSCEAC